MDGKESDRPLTEGLGEAAKRLGFERSMLRRVIQDPANGVEWCRPGGRDRGHIRINSASLDRYVRERFKAGGSASVAVKPVAEIKRRAKKGVGK